MAHFGRPKLGAIGWVTPLACVCLGWAAGQDRPAGRATAVSIVDGRWHLNGKVTYPAARAEGLLMNVRMVNAVFEDRTRPDFDADANADAFIRQIPDYVGHGVRAFTLCLQGGMPGYERAVNSAFNPNGTLREGYMGRVRRVIEACDRHGAAVILGSYYQRQDQVLMDEAALRAGVVNAARWVAANGFTNVVLEIANEFGHRGFDHGILKAPAGIAELITLAKRTAPGLLVSASGGGDGRLPDDVIRTSDFLLIHLNNRRLDDATVPERLAALKKSGKPVVCNEDAKEGADGAKIAELCVANGVSWGYMGEKVNQHFPFKFRGAADDPPVYAALKRLTTPASFPPPESKGGWPRLEKPEEIRALAGMDPDKLTELRAWLLQSDTRNFAAVVIRNGYVVLDVERGRSGTADTGNIKSCAKAVCATVLAIASEESRLGRTPRRMTFDDPAFAFIPWAEPLSDPRKARITVKQLLNHTSGLSPEATGSKNQGPWEYVLGHSGDPLTAKLAFDPGTACGYSTHALYHAALVCETVTGQPYDRFAIDHLLRPIGVEKWWFESFDGGAKIGRHPSHALGLPARDMARVAYCMLRGGRWGDRQVIPRWFVDETGAPTNNVRSSELRFKRNAQSFSHAWELPALLTGEGGPTGAGIPRDARYKPGSGGQLLAFVPSKDLVVVRQTGGSGAWDYEEYLRRACQAVLAGE